jgi:hypothetical protein
MALRPSRRRPVGASLTWRVGARPCARWSGEVCSARSVSDSAPRIEVTAEARALLAATLAGSGSAQFVRVQVERG